MFNLLKSKISSFISSITGKGETPSSLQGGGKEEKPKEAKAEIAQPPKNEPAQQQPEAKPQQEAQQAVSLERLEKKAAAPRQLEPKLGIGSAIKSIFSDQITLSESEISPLIDELELSLLEADVQYDVSLEISSYLKSKLVGLKLPKGQLGQKTREIILQSLESVMHSPKAFDLVEKAKSLPKPVKILFVGPNGAGKTTTMAKVAKKLMDEGLSVVFSASDTFRAAAIEQTEAHAQRLGIKAVKSKYGADPASVAFDAINFARAHRIDVVLIDSAGRQDTNTNLLMELKKIVRIAQPDLKIYVGESIGGNALIEQVKAFDEAIGIDGAILTKLDCDAKGGTALSIAKAAGIPILYVGTGQGYDDLVKFDPRKIAAEIMS